MLSAAFKRRRGIALKKSNRPLNSGWSWQPFHRRVDGERGTFPNTGIPAFPDRQNGREENSKGESTSDDRLLGEEQGMGLMFDDPHL
jgi:hypothetical protein